MLEFDPGEYQTNVLAKLSRQWEESGELPGKLARYGLDASAVSADPRDLERYLDKVAGYWGNRRSNARSAEFVKALIEEHPSAKAELLDPSLLRSLLDLENEEQQEKEKGREEEVLDVLERAAGPDGVIPARKFDRIMRRLGETRRGEITQLMIRNQLRVEEAIEPTSEDVMKTISKELKRLVRLEEADGVAKPEGADRLNALSLYGFLSLMQDASELAIRKAVADRKAEQQRLGPTDRNTCLGNLIGQVDVHLLDRSRRASYDVALVAGVAEQLEDELERLIEGSELSAGNYVLLVERAGEYGLPEGTAREAVNRAAADAAVVVRSPGPDPVFIPCSACGISNSNADTFCRECGSALKRKCPSCSSEELRANSNCGNCGHDFEGVARAERLEAEAKLSLDAGRVIEAIARLEDASRNDPKRTDLSRMLEGLEDRRRKADDDWREVVNAIQESRFNAVESGIEKVVEEVPDYPGSATHPLEEVKGRAAEAISRADLLVKDAASAEDPAEAERNLALALEACADCRPALARLASIEPLPPSGIDATLGEGVIRLTWTQSQSPGPITYAVTVKDQDGSTIETLETGELSITHELPAGTRGRYEVRANRAGAVSEGIETEIDALYPVIDPAIECAEDRITLRWKPIPGQQIRIARSSNDARDDLGVFERAIYEDQKVVFGESYRYELTPIYRGGSTSSIGAVKHLDGRPIKRPEAVLELHFEPTQAGLAIACDESGEGTVEVFRVSEDWGVAAGTELDLNTYRKMGERLPRASDGRFLDATATGSRASRYVAVALDGQYRISGEPLDHVALEPVTDLQLAREGRVARLTWRWPDDVRQARVLSRPDRIPAGPGDPTAAVQEITLDHYQRQGGVTVDCGDGDTHVAVYPMASIDSRPVCGSSAATVSSDVAERRVTYSVEFAKRGRRLVVQAEGDPPIPSLVIVGRSGSAPVQRDSADEELTVLNATQSAMTVEIGKRRRPFFVRAFLENPEEHPAVDVVHPSERTLRLE